MELEGLTEDRAGLKRRFQAREDVITSALDGGGVVLVRRGQNKYFNLNASAAFLWEALSKGTDCGTSAAALRSRFGVGDTRAIATCRTFIDKALSLGLLVESERPALEATKDHPLVGFIPVEWLESHAMVSWIEAPGEEFTEPFAPMTLRRLQESGARSVTASWSSLLGSGPAMDVAGIIFHIARCGSTWVCQGLRALENSLVLSEPPVLHGAWSAEGEHGRSLPPALRRALIQGTLGAFGGLGRVRGCDVFLKPNMWEVEAADLFLDSAPRASGVFLFRHPVEVIVSLSERPPREFWGEGLRNKAVRVGVGSEDVDPDDQPEMLSRITQRALVNALAHQDRLRFVSYESLLNGGLEPFLRLFRPRLTEVEEVRIRAMSGRYSKDKDQKREFVVDGEAKRARADPRIWELYERLLREPYEACLALSRNLRGPGS